MPRYIDADKFAERLKVSPAFPNMGMDGHFLRDVVLNILDNAPTADVVPRVEGEWETICHLRTDVFNAYSHICSKCEYFYKDFRPVGYTYCPKCGAKMKGGE